MDKILCMLYHWQGGDPLISELNKRFEIENTETMEADRELWERILKLQAKKYIEINRPLIFITTNGINYLNEKYPKLNERSINDFKECLLVTTSCKDCDMLSS